MALSDHDPIADERPELLLFCGLFGIFGPLAMSLGIVIVQSIAPDHNPISDTISDLARGETAWIMDTIFYFNAAAMLALALGAAHLHLGSWDWSLGMFTLTFVALIVVLLGVWDTFYSQPGVDATSVHTRLATLLFPLYLAGPLLMARAIARVSHAFRWLFIASGVLWPITALIYFYGPSEYYGITERIAGLTTLLWTVPLGWVFLRRGLRNV